MDKENKTPEIRFDDFSDAWVQRKLGDLITKGGSGGTPSTSNSEYYIGKIPFLSITDISNSNGYIYDTEKHISEDGLNSSTAWMVPAESISFAMYASVGKVAILKRMVATSQAFYNMVIPNISTRDFVYHYLKKMEEYDEWSSLISTGTQANLNAEKVKNLYVILPKDMEEQRKVGDVFNNIDNLITLHQRKCENLKEIREKTNRTLFPSVHFVNVLDLATFERSKAGKVYPAGSFTLQLSASSGQMYYLETPQEVESRFGVFTVRDGVDSAYLFTLLSITVQDFRRAYQNGLNIHPDCLRFWRIPYSEELARHSIGEIFKTLDRLIEAAKALEEIGKETKRLLLCYMFPREVKAS